MQQDKKVVVIGGGIAGSEASWQIAQQGIEVELYEMRPVRLTAAHKSDQFSELVCSNSFGSDNPGSASRMLKDEIQSMGSLTLEVARKCSVPAGASLAVDRNVFAQMITETLSSHPLIKIRREEIHEIPPAGVVIIATGPLTSDALSSSLGQLLGTQSLYFYDAISPIVATDSLDLSQMFFANRYDKGETPDFLNIPLTQEQYDQFIQDILAGEVVLPHDFEEEKYFEGCMPIEAIASRGHKTLAFGPMKPVGLPDPKTGKVPYAVIQLRAENRFRTAYNLVGFQTKLRYKEQERIFRKLPGLQEAEFLRLGSMHRNTYIESPKHLLPTLQLRNHSQIFISGQLTGTEGYLESSAGGLLAGMNAARLVQGSELLVLPTTTMLGALLNSITDPNRKNFQPSNVNMGLLPPDDFTGKKDKKAKYARYALRSQQDLHSWMLGNHLGGL
ncbi:MAG: methylenetetrahydrofolate--tRNA-(uracil(54)-C(5))-methyltransferase (FADH(2)-oxidizing) TrmFO [Proteobacteria bacterium]|nr:methylenetetrahydrofolate--tRNA-(uracil(54)-C(5))-methyltransferase (FADH(2)-oxidizing) TrmFO [Pseudomonadota bacterium]